VLWFDIARMGCVPGINNPPVLCSGYCIQQLQLSVSASLEIICPAELSLQTRFWKLKCTVQIHCILLCANSMLFSVHIYLYELLHAMKCKP